VVVNKPSISAFAVAGCAIFLLVRCTGSSSLPGTSLGTFSVVGTLGTNTCGSGVGAANPWDFTVEMSNDSGTLYLAKSDGSDQISGALSGTSATLTSVVTANVDATEAGAGTCNLTTTTTYTIDLDSSSSPTSFTGTVVFSNAVNTTVSSSTDCTDQLSSSGGEYSTLPCTVNYTLSATRQ
jgi:hypothetical protein